MAGAEREYDLANIRVEQRQIAEGGIGVLVPPGSTVHVHGAGVQAPSPLRLAPGIEQASGQLSTLQLLVDRYRIVPFAGRPDEWARLDAWAAGPERLRVCLVHGPGGMGKTRLAQEWLRRRREAGERAGFLTGALDAAAALAAAPVTVAIDYAETRPDLEAFLGRLLDGEGRARVLLLARHAGEWWAALRGRSAALAGLLERLDAELPLSPQVELADRAAELGRAVAAFAEHLKRPTPEVSPDLGDPRYKRVLYLHMAALAAVLGLDTRAEGLSGVLLDHEARIWARRLGGHEADGDRFQQIRRRMRRLAVALTLRGGLDDEEQLGPLLDALGWPEPLSSDALTTLFPPTGER